MKLIQFNLGDTRARKIYDQLIDDSPLGFVQQSSYWADTITKNGDNEAIFIMIERNGVAIGGLPLYIFSGPIGSVLTSIPGAGPLGGVVVRAGEVIEPIYATLLEGLHNLAEEKHCIASTIISNPLKNDLSLYEKLFVPDFVFENFTQVLKIEDAIIDGNWILKNNRNRNPKKNIIKAKEAGFSSKLCEDLIEFKRWVRIHEQRHQEIGIKPLPEPLLTSIYTDLCQRDRGFLQLVMKGDEIAAGCLFVHHREICDAFMLSVNSKFSNQSPNYYLIQEAMFTMWRRGIRYFNWQSSPSRESGVYSFKRQWGSRDIPYYFLTKIYCDIEKFLCLGLDGLKEGYCDNFVVPYGIFESKKIEKFYQK